MRPLLITAILLSGCAAASPPPAPPPQPLAPQPTPSVASRPSKPPAKVVHAHAARVHDELGKALDALSRARSVNEKRSYILDTRDEKEAKP